MRKLFAIVLLLGTIPQGAVAQQSGTDKAYTLALMCYAVDAHFDDSAGAKIATNAINNLAKTKGLTDSKVASDMITMASVLGVRSRTDPDLLNRYRENCRQLGMAS